MRYFLTIVILIWFIPGVSAQTYYYEKVAEVRNGAKTVASGDGHFITFTDKGCYDSDNKGFTENNGFLEYKRTANGIRNYYGDSWFGKAYYYFSTDLQRLNIKVESTGKIYVYARKTAPAGVAKSSRNKTSGNSVPASPSVSPAISIGSVPAPISFETPSSGSRTVQPRICAGCKGSGFCSMCKGKGWQKNVTMYGTTVSNCPACNGTGRCLVCHGKGSIN